MTDLGAALGLSSSNLGALGLTTGLSSSNLGLSSSNLGAALGGVHAVSQGMPPEVLNPMLNGISLARSKSVLRQFNQSHISLGSDINDINEFLKDTPGADGAAVPCGGSDRGRGDSSESVSAE